MTLSWWDRFFCLISSYNIIINSRRSIGDNSNNDDHGDNGGGDEQFSLVVAKAEQGKIYID